MKRNCSPPNEAFILKPSVLHPSWRGHFPLTTTQVVVPWLVAQETFPSGIASRSCLPRRQSCRRLSMALQLLREQAPRRVSLGAADTSVRATPGQNYPTSHKNSGGAYENRTRLNSV